MFAAPDSQRCPACTRRCAFCMLAAGVSLAALSENFAVAERWFVPMFSGPPRSSGRCETLGSHDSIRWMCSNDRCSCCLQPTAGCVLLARLVSLFRRCPLAQRCFIQRLAGPCYQPDRRKPPGGHHMALRTSQPELDRDVELSRAAAVS